MGITGIRRSRGIAVAAAIGALVVVLVAAAPAGAKKFPTSINAELTENAGPDTITGNIGSAREKKCAANRTVTLYELTGIRQYPVATGISTFGGTYTINYETRTGTDYVVGVDRKPARHAKNFCAPATSPQFAG